MCEIKGKVSMKIVGKPKLTILELLNQLFYPHRVLFASVS